MHILVLAQTPPPVHGAALINRAVLEILCAHPNSVIEHVDISASKSITDMQKNVVSKAVKSFSLFIKVCLATVAKKFKKTYINTAPTGLSSIRDYIFLTLASLRSTEVIAHFHGQLSQNSIFLKIPGTLFRKNITFIFLDSSLIPADFAKKHKRIKVLYNFAPNEIAYAKIKRLRTEERTIGFLANMLPAKGIEVFLESCAFELRSGYDFSVLIAGAWTAKYEKTQYLKWISENSDISHKFTHYGSVGAVEKITFFQKIDIFFYPTKNDAFPLVLLEAMASGVAILANDTGAIKNIVADTELLCYANDASKKLRTLLDNPTILKEKQITLRNRYYTEYSLAQFEKNLLKIFGLTS